ncbi:hypothetical protein Pint_04913 [Pistacia integerrima]|uniref:Uncharacterized protein n=1 Tax=Pistacia integerrima TaxID=434235 RepID=A0ACC0Z8R9_9ROSI|nr:hypothetical protein Pint_04913 [Pistacia integerrima]
MASMVAETWAYINGEDDSNGVEVGKFNDALLMSLLEEPHGEEYNNEQVNKVIQSLEAEPEFLNVGDNEDGENCLSSMEFEWEEMELVPSSPSDDMNWCMDQYENELDFMVDYGHVSDYSQIYNVVSSEEQSFCSLWHETYDTL